MRRISQDIDELKRNALMLEALLASGVDNWEGFDCAMDIYQELLKEAGMAEEDEENG